MVAEEMAEEEEDGRRPLRPCGGVEEFEEDVD
jgi:hypothetical protein